MTGRHHLQGGYPRLAHLRCSQSSQDSQINPRVCVGGEGWIHAGFTPPTADDTPVATAKNMPGDSADLFGDSAADDGSAANGRLWRTVIIGEQEHRIDLHMIRPYMKVVTHGGVCTPRPRPHEVTADSGSPNGGPVQLGCAGAGTVGIIPSTG